MKSDGFQTLDMMGTLPIILAFSSFFASALCKQVVPHVVSSHLILEPDFVQECPNKSTVFHLRTLRFQKYNVNVLVDGEVEYSRKVEKITRSVFTFINCEDSNPGTCQLFQTWRLGEECCSLMVKKDAFWSPIFRRLYPELRCPIHSGVYEVRNATLNVELLRLLPVPLERYYWRVTFESFDPDLWLCLQAGGRFLRSRY